MGGIRRVTLDVTGTIIRIRKDVGGMYKQVATMQGLSFLNHIPTHSINSKFKKTFHKHWEHSPNFGYSNMEAIEWWNRVTEDTLQPFSQDLELRELTQFTRALYKHFSSASAYELIPGAKDTIEKLSKRLDVVVITNNDSRIRNVLGELFDRHVLKSIIISNEEGVYKPDKRIFYRAIEGTDIKESEVLHIGDSYVNDYLPAVSLGMRAALIASCDTSQERRCETIKNITEVLRLV
ncbi:haloacid dehalogenase-like hydrolase domain-containing protein 3 [Watersipora subatra]|uniref:haloacid dehalogenase-like hydrolase domain-containing protein 3 n=1 Tax=Watersipora subatra TaxID=2589382 RepID=UPI00355C935D